MLLNNDFFGLTGRRLNRLIVATASVGFLLFGYDQGVMGGLLTLPSFVATFPDIDTINTKGHTQSKNSDYQGTVVAIYEVGGAIGALMTLAFGNKYGRLKLIWAGHFLIMIGAILQASSFDLSQMIVARIITGVGTGLNTATIPVWQSECSLPESRGKYLMIEGAMITGGVCISYWINFAFHYLSNSGSWRFPLAFQCVFCLANCLVILDLPESPRWLIQQGRLQEAKRVVDSIFSETYSESREAEFSAMVSTIQDGGSPCWRTLLSSKKPQKNLHRFILAFIHSIFHQISGINLVIYFAPKIYQEDLGLSANQTRIVSATVNGLAYFFSSFISTTIIETVGRRKLMLLGSAGMALGMAVVSGTTAYASNKACASVAAAFIFFIQFSFAVGWLAIVWLYPAEIVNTSIRNQVNSINVTTTWLFNFLIVEITPIMLANMRWKSYIVFAALNVLIACSIYLFYPETAGRSLEEIDEIFNQSNGIFDVVNVSLRLPYRNSGREVGTGDIWMTEIQGKEKESSEHEETKEH